MGWLELGLVAAKVLGLVCWVIGPFLGETTFTRESSKFGTDVELGPHLFEDPGLRQDTYGSFWAPEGLMCRGFGGRAGGL